MNRSEANPTMSINQKKCMFLNPKLIRKQFQVKNLRKCIIAPLCKSTYTTYNVYKLCI